MRDRIRAAIASLPPRERKVIGLYYYGEATMKQIGAEIGVNESRVSQLHARAVQRLRKALGAECPAEDAISPAVLSFQSTMRRLRMAKADMPQQPGVVLQYRTPQVDTKPRRRVVRRHAAPRADCRGSVMRSRRGWRARDKINTEARGCGGEHRRQAQSRGLTPRDAAIGG